MLTLIFSLSEIGFVLNNLLFLIESLTAESAEDAEIL
jgi:hypothetical protein